LEGEETLRLIDGTVEGSHVSVTYDPKLGELILSRSPDGAHCLYYMEEGERFLFASEIGGILSGSATAREVPRARLMEYLRLPDAEPIFLYESIHPLRAGVTLLRNRLGSSTVSVPSEETKAPREPLRIPQTAEEAERLLWEETIRRGGPFFPMPEGKRGELRRVETLLLELLQRVAEERLTYLFSGRQTELLAEERELSARIRRIALMLQAVIWSGWVNWI
jgi:hypothetical protein